MVFVFSVKLLPNQRIVAMGRAGALKMEARGPRNGFLGRQNESHDLQDEARERQGGLSECQNGCPDGPW